MIRLELPEDVVFIIKTLEDHGFEAFAVGGCVRDSLLGKKPHDWDVTTSAKPADMKRIFRRTIDTGIEHGTVTILHDGAAIETTTYRIDGIYEDSRHPKNVEFTSDLTEDLRRRDFTINAMAYNPSTGIVDKFGGLEDLKAGVIRCVGDPFARFNEDALRLFRAIRFSAQLNFGIEEETKKAIAFLAPNLSNISAERICAELIKTITSDSPGKIRLAYELGVTKIVLPEFDKMMETEQNTKHHWYSVGEHTIKTMESIPPERILRLTMLLHDIGKPLCKRTDDNGVDHFKTHAVSSEKIAEDIMRRLKLDNETIKNVRMLIRFHDWHYIPDEVNVRRLMHDMGDELMEDFFLVQRADLAGQSDYRKDQKQERIDNSERIYDIIKERGDCTSLKELALTGDDILSLGIKRGPRVGRILEAALDDVIENPDHNNKDYLKKFAIDQDIKERS